MKELRYNRQDLPNLLLHNLNIERENKRNIKYKSDTIIKYIYREKHTENSININMDMTKSYHLWELYIFGFKYSNAGCYQLRNCENYVNSPSPHSFISSSENGDNTTNLTELL